MIIGKFTRTEHGYEGFIQIMFGDGVGCIIVPQDKGADFTVTTDNQCELGAGWKKTAKSGTNFVSIRLDSPALPAPIHCALFPGKNGTFDLTWRRQADED
jgi:uncharacterized protein (DUF736 family)